jgi:hypothetical protein
VIKTGGVEKHLAQRERKKKLTCSPFHQHLMISLWLVLVIFSRQKLQTQIERTEEHFHGKIGTWVGFHQHFMSIFISKRH